MAVPLSARKLVDRVRKRVADTGSLNWEDYEILEAADDALQGLHESVRLSGADLELDRIEFSPSTLVETQPQWREYQLPEYAADVRRVEGVLDSRVYDLELVAADLDNKDLFRQGLTPTFPAWCRTRWGRSGTIGLFGALNRFTSLRIWFTRRFPPLHYGTAQAGAANASQMIWAATPTGVIVNRTGWYTSMLVEITSDSSAANIGQIRRISSDTVVSDVYRPVFETAWPATPGSSSVYSLMVPLEGEHTELLIEETTRRLLERSGNEVHLSAMLPRLMELKERFHSGLRKRDTGKPLRLWSRR